MSVTAGLLALEAPEALITERLVLAARVAEEISTTEPVVAALVVGSTALRRCSPRADLDLIVVTPSSPPEPDRFASRLIDGVRVEVERLGRREALALTTGGGWVWELRQAARLGCGVPVLDADSFARLLSERAAAMTPWRDRFESTLRDVYLLLIGLGPAGGDPARRSDALRGCFDNLALLALLERPRRYQKAKWALADLSHAGEDVLVEGTLAAYGITSDDAGAANDATTGARDLVERAYTLAGVPSHDAILAMGHAPALAEASYVSRCLDDAEDLAASGRYLEAQYVAKFSARLAAGMLSEGDGEAGVVDTLASCGLAPRYLALFDATPDLLKAALRAADARREVLDR